MTFVSRGGLWVAAQMALFALAGASLLIEAGDVDAGAPLIAAGVVVAASGAVLGAAGAVALGRNLTPFPAPVAGGRLVVHGVYRLCRHPIYGGVALAILGVGVAAGDPGAVAVGLLLVPFLYAKSAREEGRLTTAYPGYGDYRRSVPKRLIPWIV